VQKGCVLVLVALSACSKRRDDSASRGAPVPVASPEVPSPSASSAEPTVLAALENVTLVDADDKDVYVSSEVLDGRVHADIYRVSKTGGAPVKLGPRQPPVHQLLPIDGMLFFLAKPDIGKGAEVRLMQPAGDPKTIVDTSIDLDTAFAADAHHLYFFAGTPRDQVPSSVKRIPRAGGAAEELASTKSAKASPLVRCGAGLYWTATDCCADAATLDTSIIELLLDGPKRSTPKTIATIPNFNASQMTCDGNALYLTGGPLLARDRLGAVHRLGISPDAGALERLAAAQAQPWAIAVDDKAVYFTVEDALMKYDKKTRALKTLAAVRPSTNSLAVDGTFVYFASRDGVLRVPKD
jgi:hypothetical protein